MASGDVEGVHDAQKGSQQGNVPDTDRLREGQEREGQRKDHRRGLGGNDDAVPIVAIGQGAAEGRQHEHRNLSGEAHCPQQHRGARKAVDQPGLRDGLHPGAGQRDELPAKEQAKIAMPQRAQHEGGAGRRAGHFLEPSNS